MHHGILLMDKPQGWTSHDLVAKVRKLMNMSEVGHCGTLDPMATGLMILTLGKATKISQYMLEREKRYSLKAKLGVRTDTLDMTGTVLSEKPVAFSESQISEAMKELQGDLHLLVPKYSAVKIAGQKLYEYARNNEEVQAPTRVMTFFDFKTLGIGADWVELEMSCSKGSYVRSWVEALGEKLGEGATLSGLTRTQSNPYAIEQAICLEDLQSEQWSLEKRGFIPLAMALPEYKTIRVQGMDLSLIRNGQISKDLKSQLISTFKPGKDVGVKVISQTTGDLMAIIGLEAGKGFVIRRVFQY